MSNINGVALSAYSDLVRLMLDERASHVRGKPTRQMVGGKPYWYAVERIGNKQKRHYIGPDTDVIRTRVERIETLRTESSKRREERRRLTRILRAERMAPVDVGTGKLLLAMEKVGVFRLGGTLVGTNAFRLMEPELRRRIPLDSAAFTGDIDIAQFERLSLAIGDQVKDSLADTFGALDLKPVPGLDARQEWRFRRQGENELTVEFLTPSFEENEGIKPLPALQVNAQALHHLNYLIADPIPAVALYRSGVLVQIPRPERFAIHKLIVADRRRDSTRSYKSEKDRMQAAFIIETLAEVDPDALWDAYADAMERGPKWRDRITRTLTRMPETKAALLSCDG